MGSLKDFNPLGKYSPLKLDPFGPYATATREIARVKRTGGLLKSQGARGLIPAMTADYESDFGGLFKPLMPRPKSNG